MVTNMVVELSSASFQASGEDSILAGSKVSLTHARGASEAERAWIRQTFNPMWAREAAEGWNWFLKDAQGSTVGFATYEQRALRFWWVRRWLKRADVGIFGPVGVDPAQRGLGLGCLLVRRALASLRELGYARAVIPHVTSETFYERCCDARVVERLRFLGLF